MLNSNDIANILADSIVEKAATISDLGFLDSMYQDMTSYAKAECSSCNNTWDTNIQFYISTDLYKLLDRRLYKLSIKYSSEALKIDTENISKIYSTDEWYRLTEGILKDKFPEKLQHLRRIEEIKDAFTPERGGDGVDPIYIYLTAIAVGLATRIIYDLLKWPVHKVQKKLKSIKEKKLLNQQKQRISDLKVLAFQPDDYARTQYSNEVLNIIASMPKRRRNRILRQIALQHATNTKNQLLNAIMRYKGTDSSEKK
jgi:hypothetical protein